MPAALSSNILSLEYLFKSERLGFRNWKQEDIEPFAEMCADEKVMAYFPTKLNRTEARSLIERLVAQFEKHGYTYYSTELLATGEWIGFIGMAWQEYESIYTPATDIGWRLKSSAWGKGFATEGAKRCLEHAFGELKLKEIISVCPLSNRASERVMQKIGLVKAGEFDHPKLGDYPKLRRCVCYSGTSDVLKKRNIQV